MNPAVSTFIENSTKWSTEMAALRPMLLDSGLTESIKWRQPCYSHHGRNVAIMQPMKDFLSLMFFKGALLSDPNGILEEQGTNTRSARRVRFSSVQDVRRTIPILRSCVDEAMRIEEAGVKVGPPPDTVFIDELQRRLDRDAAFKAAFQALTPGRQRGYNLYFASAKQAGTREARIEKYAPKILEGLGLHDR